MTRRGFSLLEMLVVMALFTLFLGVCAVMVRALIDAHAADLRALERSAVLKRLDEQFRADVAAADDTPAKAGEFAAGPECLILKRADGVIVYRVVEGVLHRTDPAVKGAQEMYEVVGEESAIVFRREGRLVTVRWTVSPGPAQSVLDISAALGGDRR